MSLITRHATRPASRNWRRSAACQGVDEETVFSTRLTEQARVKGICRGCPVRSTCLTDAMSYEAGYYMSWGVQGGLSDLQRIALRVEMKLGNQPDLEQARKLASPVFAGFMQQWRDWPPETVAVELRRHGVIASAVTVRLALWWTGADGSLLPPTAEGDVRAPWMRVRDELRDTVSRIRGLGFSNRETVAYLGVARDAFERAVRSWRADAEQEVAAA